MVQPTSAALCKGLLAPSGTAQFVLMPHWVNIGFWRAADLHTAWLDEQAAPLYT
jgi:hypothetical protein